MIMNILVLTPDRVGSSLLQKFLTVTMQHYDYGKPVINLHELTNGLELYKSPIYNQEVLGKPKKTSWGYYQSLKEITSLLSSADHYKVSRLAQYHILNRKDSLQDQLSFYQYINENFYIISARRENLFEHALSWCIVAFTKHLNLYMHEDKISVFKKLYQNKITIDQTVFASYLSKYLDYLTWVDSHFIINSVFNYDTNSKDLEKYVNNLDIFPNSQPILSWQASTGISWNDWNKCHYLISDTSNFSATPFTALTNTILPQISVLSSMDISALITRPSLSLQNQQFLTHNMNNYISTYQTLSNLITTRTLIDGIPIKLQTLAEKAMMIKNLHECINTYNNWSIKNGQNHQISIDSLKDIAFDELNFWYNNDK